MKALALLVVLTSGLAAAPPDEATWQPVDGPLMTRWAKEISPDNVLPEYPRPQMVRQQWLNLNGLWDYAILPKDGAQPDEFDGRILVPFAAESALSGVMKTVGGDNRLWYQRTFRVPEEWSGERVLLHFEGVDWETTVWVNGREVGTHRGGYDPFTFDVTKALSRGEREEVVVSVWDPTNDGPQPRGKQVKEPRGIWYTSVTGIWRTVWLEPVPEASIADMKMTTDVDAGTLKLTVETSGAAGGETVRAVALDGDEGGRDRRRRRSGRAIDLEACPAEALVARRSVPLRSEGEPRPRRSVRSTRWRVISGCARSPWARGMTGFVRMMLNGEFVFQYGPLDQGWWPDGLYTAPTDEALRYDLEVLKEMGCNMLRKHVKVEPRRLYYWCDKLGLSGLAGHAQRRRPHPRRGQPDFERTPESAAQFELELKQLMETLGNHPSIVVWVPFNEGWGQFDTARIVDLVKDSRSYAAGDQHERLVGSGRGPHHGHSPISGAGHARSRSPIGRSCWASSADWGCRFRGTCGRMKGSWGYRGYKTKEEFAPGVHGP